MNKLERAIMRVWKAVVMAALCAAIPVTVVSCSDLYGKYEDTKPENERMCTITFMANGGYGTMTAQKAAFSTNVYLKKNTFTRTGYAFTGWAIYAGSTVPLYSDGESYYTGINNVTLYAVWSDVSMTMKYVLGGTFYNGKANMTVSSFYIGTYEVTQRQYEQVMGSLPGSSSISYGLGDDYPVYCVTLYDTLVFCNKLSRIENLTPVFSINGSTDPDDWGAIPVISSYSWDNATINFSANGYRLPTEAEWEFAVRGGNLTHLYAYAGSANLGDVGWYEDNSNKSTHPVGKKLPNELGLYDMSGNVWERCYDWYGAYPVSAQTDYCGPGTGSNKVDRGGCWINSAGGCAISYRNYSEPSFTGNGLGFRVVRSRW